MDRDQPSLYQVSEEHPDDPEREIEVRRQLGNRNWRPGAGQDGSVFGEGKCNRLASMLDGDDEG